MQSADLTKARQRGARAGFMLIEMLVTVAIIAVLAAVVVAPEVFRNVGDANGSAARQQIEIFGTALDSYRLSRAYPTTEQGLVALRAEPVAGERPRTTRGPYRRRDISANPGVNVAPGRVNPQGFNLYPLGREGSEGEDANVTSWGAAEEVT